MSRERAKRLNDEGIQAASMGRYEVAHEKLTAATQEDPDWYIPWNNLATLYRDMGDTNSAMRCLAAAAAVESLPGARQPARTVQSDQPAKKPSTSQRTSKGRSAASGTGVIRFECPHCHRKLRVKADLAGKRGTCPNPECGATITAPTAEGQSRQQTDSADWHEMLTYLSQRHPAEISTITNEDAIEVVSIYKRAVVDDPTHPNLSYYLLKGTKGGSPSFPHFPYIVVTTGDLDAFNRAWTFNYEAVLKRALPGKTWDDFAWGGSSANHSKPGCHLASTDPFDRLVAAIEGGHYQLIQVFRPDPPGQGSSSDGSASTDRWEVDIIGEELVHPGVKCQSCGEDRVALGRYGSLLECATCGFVYCRRNCQASIRGQCPKCGETDRINYVTEARVKDAKKEISRPAGPIQVEDVAADLAELVGSDGGFAEKSAIREVGAKLHESGGMELMQQAYYAVRGTGRYFSQDIWDGIGEWRC